MSRYDGWLTRFIVRHGTPAAIAIKDAAKQAGIRPDTFAKALRDPALIRQDAKHIGFDPDEARDYRQWLAQMQADDDFEASMIASAAAIKRYPSSDKYCGSKTRIGLSCPNPGGSRSHRDGLNLPINPIPHPEPQGEWHEGLNAASGG